MNNQTITELQVKLDQAISRLERELAKGNAMKMGIEAGQRAVSFCQRQLANAQAVADRIASGKADAEDEDEL